MHALVPRECTSSRSRTRRRPRCASWRPRELGRALGAPGSQPPGARSLNGLPPTPWGRGRPFRARPSRSRTLLRNGASSRGGTRPFPSGRAAGSRRVVFGRPSPGS
ncbi:hypothetical protein ADL05_16425 [Nocardiopsis sp. NRRL B-16309]|nr:hypothetical protein ADL05_16425 [Nocardiopsis sp. NRRL B-16309]